VTVKFWGIDKIEGFTTLEASGLQLDHLTRCDSYTEADDQKISLPPATKFSCVSKVGEKYIKFVVSVLSHYNW
jgi:hypothetical protein